MLAHELSEIFDPESALKFHPILSRHVGIRSDFFLDVNRQGLTPSTQPVADEIARCGDPSDPAALWLNGPESSSFIAGAPSATGFVAAWDLGAGESSVISLAETIPESTVVLDDLAARRCAEALHLKLVGTLGLLLMAKRRGVSASRGDSMDAIVDAGLFISPKPLASIRKLAGE